MRKFFNLMLAITFLLFINSCKDEATEQKEEISIPPAKKGSFYETDLNKGNSIVIADTIIYDVVIKNALPEDEWQEFRLKNVDRAAIANIIFNAIYNGKLTAYDYQNENPMTIDQVKELEKEYIRDKVAKIQFIEEWYFNEEKMKMGKRVNEIMLAYELNNPDGEIRGYKAGVKVYLTDKNKNP
ncbi:MAG: hypothetical protein ABFS35_13385 [Bacteroidota bacterium]